MRRLGVCFGGISNERDISVITALQVIQACQQSWEVLPFWIDPQGRWWTGDALFNPSSYPLTDTHTLEPVHITCYRGVWRWTQGTWWTKECTPDVWLPCFHGAMGEDGTIQGWLTMLQQPFLGPSQSTALLTMDKWWTKQVLQAAGIPVVQGWCVDTTMHPALPFPATYCVKPRFLGSSIGVHIVETQEALHAALQTIFTLDTHAIIEPALAPLEEYTIAVCGAHVSGYDQLNTRGGPLTFEDKYSSDATWRQKLGGLPDGWASVDRTLNPPKEWSDDLQHLARAVYQAIGATGAPRIDFFRHAGQLYVCEVNAIPGSLAFYLWLGASPPITLLQLVEWLYEQQPRHQLQRAPPLKVL